MSFFSSTAFLETVADVLYPHRSHTIERVHIDGRVFRLLVLDQREVVTHGPFIDYFEPLDREIAPSRALAYLPRAVHDTITAEAWQTRALPPGFEPSPYIDWRAFADWDNFLGYVHARSLYPYKINLRKRRKIERELGPVHLTRAPQDDALLQLCMAWKSAQYRRTGMWDVFASARNRRLFLELGRRNLLVMDALWAGERVVAIHAGVVWEQRFYYWLPAHDPETSSYSPGTLLLEELIERGYRERLEFDFLLGNEPYKWWYATHARIVGPVGQKSLAVRLALAARNYAVGHIRDGQPAVYAFLQALKRRLREAALLP